MTATRIVEPGLTVMFTRRTVARFYLLRPDRRTRQIFLYCLGVAAERHGILLHALVVMSTHYHLVATDVRGVYPGTVAADDETGVSKEGVMARTSTCVPLLSNT